MALNLLAILACLLIELAVVCIFIFMVKRDYFRNIEDAQYQFFWSDVEALLASTAEESNHDTEKKQ